MFCPWSIRESLMSTCFSYANGCVGSCPSPVGAAGHNSKTSSPGEDVHPQSFSILEEWCWFFCGNASYANLPKKIVFFFVGWSGFFQVTIFLFGVEGWWTKCWRYLKFYTSQTLFYMRNETCSKNPICSSRCLWNFPFFHLYWSMVHCDSSIFWMAYVKVRVFRFDRWLKTTRYKWLVKIH